MPNFEYDLILSHAPNLKNHFRYINSLKQKDKKIVFFIHGHEALKINKYYLKDYHHSKKDFIKRNIIQNIYDKYKLYYLKKYTMKHQNNIHFVFVSEWMKEQFILNTKLQEKYLDNIHSIIHNGVNSVFLEQSYSPSNEFLGDFITIRPMNNPKYGIDIVDKLARTYQNYEFHIYGKGSYYKDKDVPNNVKIYERFFQQDEIPALLNQYRYALMPTRLDAQGVMACEMATYGIPLITSNIQICKEMIGDFPNVTFIDNNNPKFNQKELNRISISKTVKSEKFSTINTVCKEIEIFEKFLKNKVSPY